MPTAVEQLLHDLAYQSPNDYGNPIALRHLAEDIDLIGPGGPFVPVADLPANVLLYGADPTGVADSTAAFNAAAAVVASGSTRHKAVYFPTGTYRINGQINLTACQEFYGDSRGSSVLLIDDQFDPTATSVTATRSAFYDSGVFLHDFGITFAQPSDQTSRANFKTLAAGGTSGLGGTGVKYPWAIACAANSGRIQIVRVRIGGAWDGITSNGFNTVFYLDNVEMGALDCGLSLGEGASGILDFCHITAYHFWNFDIPGALYTNVFSDGQTIAMRMGRVDGLEIKGFLSHRGRLVITSDAAGNASLSIATCAMDTAQATIEINGAMLYFSIANLSGAAAADRTKPFVTVNAACALNIANHYSHSSSAFSDFLVNDPNAVVSITNFRSLFHKTDIYWAEVQRGILRITNGLLFTDGPRTVAAFAETSTGHLIIDDVSVASVSGVASSGPLVLVTNVNSTISFIGTMSFQSGHTWTFSLPAGITQSFYSPNNRFPGASIFARNVFLDHLVQVGISGGGTPGGVVIVGAAGEQKSLSYLRGTLTAWSVVSQGATDDFILQRWNDAGVFQDNPISVDRSTGIVTTTALNAASIGGTTPSGGTFTQLTLGTTSGPVFRVVTGVPSATLPKGSVSIRSDGGVGSTFYVTQGGGVWNPVAGV